MQDNYLSCSKYKGHNRNSNGFVKFENEGEFYFAYIDENGNVILRSEGYKSEASRDNGIQSVMKNMDDDTRYKAIQQEVGTWVLSLSAANHQEIAQTCPVASEEAAKAFLPSQRSKARAAAMSMFTKNTTNDTVKTKGIVDNYLVCSEYEERIADSKSTKHVDFIEFQHTNSQYYFAWIYDGKIAMRSEGYPTTAARDNGIDSVIKNRGDKNRYKTEEVHGAHFLILKAGNGQEIARSCPKKTANEVSASLDLLSGLGIGNITSAIINIEKPKIETSVMDAFKAEVPKVEVPVAKTEVPVVEKQVIVEAPEVKLETSKIKSPIVETPKQVDESQKFISNNTLIEEKEPSNLNWLFWLLALLGLGLLLWVILNKGCKNLHIGKSTSSAIDSVKMDAEAYIDTNILLDDAGIIAKSAWDSTLGEMVNINLPNGTSVVVPINGSEKKLIEFLNSGCNGELKKTWFNLDRVLFITGSSKLNSVSNEQLNVISKIMEAYPDTKFKIGGYTDNVGDSMSNVKLSFLRALSVDKTLESKGSGLNRVRSEGYGPMHPICPENNTPECKAMNRRVSIRVDTCNIMVKR